MFKITMIGMAFPRPYFEGKTFGFFQNFVLPRGETTQFEFVVRNGEIAVTYDLPEVYAEAVHWCWRYANVALEPWASAASLVIGGGVDIFIDYFIDPSGRRHPLWVVDERLSKNIDAFSQTDEGWVELATFLSDCSDARRVADDALMGIRRPDYMPIAGGRIVDRIKHIVTPDAPRGDAGWAPMRDSLFVSRQFLEVLSAASVDPRHGNPKATDDGTYLDLSVRVWQLVNRYLHFERLGRHPLDRGVFQEL